MKNKTHKVSEKKKGVVKELSDLIKNRKTVLIASIKNLPASQFQEISKKLRSKAVVKVLKKNLILKAIDESKNEKAKELKDYIKEDSAVLFSDIDSFDLASELIENKSPAKAKVGQESPKDIEVEAGPTDLVPGPAISEPGGLGIQIQIDKGKIHIKESKIIVKKGEKISEAASSLMNKLDIRPFSIGFIPMIAFDTKEGKIYFNMNVDKEGTLAELKKLYSKALAFAVGMEYFSAETINFIVGKAGIHGKAIENLFSKSSDNKSEGEN